MKSKIHKFHDVVLDDLREDIVTAFTKIGNKYGLAIDYGGMKYSDTSINAKVTIILADDSGKPTMGLQETKWVENLKRHGRRYGIDADPGTKITCNGNPYILVGLRPKARLKVVALQDPNTEDNHFIALPHSSILIEED